MPNATCDFASLLASANAGATTSSESASAQPTERMCILNRCELTIATRISANKSYTLSRSRGEQAMCHASVVKFLQLCTIRTPAIYETLSLVSPVVDRRDGILSTVGLRAKLRRLFLQIGSVRRGAQHAHGGRPDRALAPAHLAVANCCRAVAQRPDARRRSPCAVSQWLSRRGQHPGVDRSGLGEGPRSQGSRTRAYRRFASRRYRRRRLSSTAAGNCRSSSGAMGVRPA